jgi:hypothetical protein
LMNRCQTFEIELKRVQKKQTNTLPARCGVERYVALSLWLYFATAEQEAQAPDGVGVYSVSREFIARLRSRCPTP